MDRDSGSVTVALQQTLSAVLNFVSRFSVQLGYEEPRSLVVIIYFDRQRKATIPIFRLPMVLITDRPIQDQRSGVAGRDHGDISDV